MEKIYGRINFVDNSPPFIDAENLNKMDYTIDELDNRVVEINTNLSVIPDTYATKENLKNIDSVIDELDNRVLGLDTTKLDKSTANTMVKDVSLVESTGIFTITLLNGTTKTIDTKLEKIATNFRYDYESQKLILTLVDGTEQNLDLSSLISQYEFANSDTISFSVDSSGKVSAIIPNGSITEEKLGTDYLAEIKTEVSNAKSSAASSSANATIASESAQNANQFRDEAESFRDEALAFRDETLAEVSKAKGYSDSSYENATNASTSAQEAKQYRDEAKQYRDEIEAVENVDIATTEKAGIVKPDGTTITVDEDGTVHAVGGNSGTSDYNGLSNKPSIGGVVLSGNKTLASLGIQPAGSYLTEETDPTVPEWAKNSTKPTYTKSEVGLGNVPNVATNDQTPTFTRAGSRSNIVSGEPLSEILGKIMRFFTDLKMVAFSGSYNDLNSKPAIPTKTSDLTNDSGFLKLVTGLDTSEEIMANTESGKLAGARGVKEMFTEVNESLANGNVKFKVENGELYYSINV